MTFIELPVSCLITTGINRDYSKPAFYEEHWMFIEKVNELFT